MTGDRNVTIAGSSADPDGPNSSICFNGSL
jgi:hypothetical protein